MRTWSAVELGRFLAHVRDDRLYAAWALAANTGLRPGEVLGLRWSDIDLDACTVSVRRSLISIGYAVAFSEPKTAKSRRSVSLDTATVTALREHRRRQAEERLAWGPGYSDQGLVFCRENGEPVHPDRLTDMFERRVKSSGLPPIRLHDLRHSHATLGLAAGIHAKVMSERLGHSTVAMTLDLYSHSVPRMQADAAELIAALLQAAD